MTIDSVAAAEVKREMLRDTSMGRYLARSERAFIAEHLGAQLAARRVLDVGCGNGDLSRTLLNRNLDLVGMDVDQQALSAFKQRVPDTALLVAQAQRLPFNDGSFDHVLAIQCLSYFDPDWFLRECQRVLVAGGGLIFTSLNRRNYKRLLRELAGPPVQLVSNMSSAEILRATEAHGFELLAVRGYGWAPFSRESNSQFVEPFALVEHLARLERYSTISPRLLIAARKRPSC